MAAILATGCGRTARQYLDRGNQLFAEGKYEDAALNYRNAAKKDSQSAEIPYRLALALLKLNKAPDAYQALNQAVALNPKYLPASVELAGFCLSVYALDPSHPAGMYNRARSLTDGILAAEPNSTDGLRLKGGIALLDNRAAEAIETFGRALKIAPDKAELHAGLAEALIKNNQPEDGEREAKQAIARQPQFGPAYDLLYSFYVGQQRWQDAEALLKSRIANNPKDSASVVRLAGFYHRLKRPDDAEKTINSLLDQRAVFPQADLLAGDFHFVARDWEKALADYQRGLGRDKPREKVYEQRSAAMLAVLGRREEALKALDAILAKDGKDLFARSLKVQVLAELGGAKNLELAAALGNDLAKEAPRSLRIQMIVAQALLAKGDLEGASARLQQAIKDDPRSLAPRLALARVSMLRKNYAMVVEQSDAALAIKPDEPNARLFRIIGLTGRGDYAQAKVEAQQLARDSPNERQVQMQLGIIALGQKRYAEAEANFRKMYREGDRDLQPLAGLVSTFVAENMPDRALQLVEAEMKRAPESAGASALLVATAQAAGKPDVALAELQKLAAKNPNSPEVKLRIAELERKRGNFPAALEQLQQARKIAPDRKGIDAVVASVQDQAGQKKEAIASYRTALSKTPDDPFLMNNLAYLLADTGGDLNQALELVNAGLRKQPSNPSLQDTLAWIHIKRGSVDKALPVLATLTHNSPNETIFRFHYAMALFQSGDRASAKRQLEVALSQKPAAPMESAIRGLLAQVR